jgi:serine/threonine protein kinase
MTAERWAEVRNVLYEALDRPAEERSAFLNHACSGDDSLRKEVESLLAADEQASSSEPAQFSSIAPVRLASGTQIDDYEIEALLGSGGMGEVYRARDLRLNKKVAIKVLPASLSADQQWLRRFEREARALAALNHPNIMAVYRLGTHQGAPFLVSELLEGQTLREELRKGPLPLRKAIDYGLQVTRGLAAAHHHGIIHRDLKPDNLFITRDGRAKILDFGLAKLLQPAAHSGSDGGAETEATQQGLVVGTPGYMSPEQVRGLPADPRSDVFGLGAILYEMFSGKRAFLGDTRADTFGAVLNQEPRRLSQLVPGLLPGLEHIVDRCLAKDPEERFQSVSDVGYALEALTDPFTPPASSPRQEQAWYRLARWWVATAILVIAGVLVYWRGMDHERAGFDFQDMTITKLTDDGRVSRGAISPDGKYVAYVSSAPQPSLWVEQIATERTVQLVPPQAGNYWWITFSRDGDYVYYVLQQEEDRTQWDLFVVPMLGGPPRLLIKNVSSGVGISPDGNRMAFIAERDDGPRTLTVANIDGTDEWVLAKASFNRFAPSWSPDGTLIAAVVGFGGEEGPELSQREIAAYPLDGGKPTLLASRRGLWQAIWLPGQVGLLTQVSPGVLRPDHSQIWVQPFPRGEPRRVTNDLNTYYNLDLTVGGNLLMAVQEERSSTVFVSPASEPDGGGPITSAKVDGVSLAWTPEGKLLMQNARFQLLSVNPDGTGRVAVHDTSETDSDFSVCPRSGFVVFRRRQDSTTSIWRMDSSGRNLKQLAAPLGLEGSPQCSPDGTAAIYTRFVGGRSTLMKVPIEGGRPFTLLEGAGAGRYSPDGKQVALYRPGTPTGVVRSKLAVMSSAGGLPTQTFDITPEGNVPIPLRLRWTADGRALTYPVTMNGATNLWIQPLVGGPARQLTHYHAEVTAYDWSPDGKWLAATRSHFAKDIVLISHFR